MQSNNFTSIKQNIMRWTQPSTPDEIRYYSKFGGLLKVIGICRFIVQFGLWWVVASGALVFIVQESTAKFLSPPLWLLWALSLLITGVLHKLFSEFTRVHYFDKWDDNPDTNSTIWVPLLIGGFLVLLEYQALKGYFVGKVVQPVTITDNSDADYSKQLQAVTANYDAEKARIEENYSQRAELIAAPLLREQERLIKERKRAKSAEDLAYIKTKLSQVETKINSNQKLLDLRLSTDAQLATLLAEHQKEQSRLKTVRDGKSLEVAGLNGKGVAQYEADKKQAVGLAGALSLFCFVFTFLFLRSEVRIKTKSGIFPIREFSDLDANGTAMEKASEVFTDIFSRKFHQLIYGYHRRAIKSMGDVSHLDGSLEVKASNYASKNGRRIPLEYDEPGKN